MLLLGEIKLSTYDIGVEVSLKRNLLSFESISQNKNIWRLYVKRRFNICMSTIEANLNIYVKSYLSFSHVCSYKYGHDDEIIMR